MPASDVTPPVVSPRAAASPPPTLVLGSPTPDLPGVPALQGLDGTPRDTPPVENRQLAPFPGPSVPAFDPDHTVLYDLAEDTAIDLGPGSMGVFSPDSRLMAWASGAPDNLGPSEEIWVMDLETKQKWSLGQGRHPIFQDRGHIIVVSRDPVTKAETSIVIDVQTGARSSYAPPDPGSPYLTSVIVDKGSGRLYSSRYVLYDAPGGRPVFQFVAGTASLVGPDELVVATVPAGGTTNIYVVAIQTQAVTFTATARWTQYNFPLSATKDYVIWNNDYCGGPKGVGHIMLYTRQTKTLTEIEATQFVTMTPDNLIAVGQFGAKALIDPDLLEYVYVLPGGITRNSPGFDPSNPWSGRTSQWSPNYHYASQGVFAGHGGLCG